MNRKTNLLALLAAGAVTVLALAGLSTAAGTSAPSNQNPPTISGTPQEGSTLTASTGTWNGTSPFTYSYQWRRCDANGGSCSNISGANDKTYTLKGVDVGNTIRVRVTAKNADGSSTATSVPTGVVQKKPSTPPTQNGCPSGTGAIDVSQLSLPARLVVDGQQASPTTVSKQTTQDLTLRFHVSACGGRPVQGALVYAAAVPFNQYSISEVPTGADGWATLTEHRLGGFPASSKQQLLAVFVRARKPGENLTGGVSTRLLVSFPVTR
ncbi:MAG TPA: hypothetical protein VI408_06440 [Gaiellaceae bacterium]